MARLAEYSLLVIGGDSELGCALIEAALTEGARVSTIGASDSAMQRISAQFGSALQVLTADRSQRSSLQAAQTAILTQHGKLNGLIALASAVDDGATLMACDDAESNPHFAAAITDLSSMYLRVAQVFAPSLRQSRGAMLFTLAPAALAAGVGGGLHTIAQHAGAALVRQLAYELMPAPQVYGVCIPTLPRSAGSVYGTRLAPGERITAPRYVADPTTWFATYLDLLAPATAAPASGTIVTAAGSDGFSGAVTLA